MLSCADKIVASGEESKYAVLCNYTVKFIVKVSSPSHKAGLKTEAKKIENLPQAFHCINLITTSIITVLIASCTISQIIR
jgi:hypothetical protein